MSKKQIDIYRTGIYLRLSQGDEDIDGLENINLFLTHYNSSYRSSTAVKIASIDI